MCVKFKLLAVIFQKLWALMSNYKCHWQGIVMICTKYLMFNVYPCVTCVCKIWYMQIKNCGLWTTYMHTTILDSIGMILLSQISHQGKMNPNFSWKTLQDISNQMGQNEWKWGIVIYNNFWNCTQMYLYKIPMTRKYCITPANILHLYAIFFPFTAMIP